MKDLIGLTLHLSPDALHIHMGLALFVGGAALMRTERRFVHALGWLLAVCLVGEALDLSADYSKGYGLRWLNSAKDIVNTMFWPAAWVLARPLMARLLPERVPLIPPGLEGTGK
jgi:hypothetical protein